jgi:hypothetical protein
MVPRFRVVVISGVCGQERAIRRREYSQLYRRETPLLDGRRLGPASVLHLEQPMVILSAWRLELACAKVLKLQRAWMYS